MAVNLSKGGNVNLSKTVPGLDKILVGLGWKPRVTDGKSFDVDSSVFMLNATGKVRSDADFIFYNNKNSTCGSIMHGGDNTTGVGEGDDEKVMAMLSCIPADVEKIVFAVTIHDAETNKQNFGMISDAFIRVVDSATNKEIARYDLSEDASLETSMNFGELYKHNGEWKFKAMGQGFMGGLKNLAGTYGVSV